MLRRIGILASLAVVAAMFAGVQSAQAQTAGVCVFSGLAGGLTPIPNITADTATPSIERGTYSFSTAGGGTAACAGQFEGQRGVATTANGSLTIDSEGYYDNIYCGTGWAHDLNGNGTFVRIGTGTIPPSTGATITDAGFEIPFVAGVGPLLIGPDDAPATAAASGLIGPGGHGAHVTANDVGTEDENHGPLGGDGKDSKYVGGGAVVISAGSGEPPTVTHDNCFNQDDGDSLANHTNEFLVAGFFVAADDPQYDLDTGDTDNP